MRTLREVDEALAGIQATINLIRESLPNLVMEEIEEIDEARERDRTVSLNNSAARWIMLWVQRELRDHRGSFFTRKYIADACVEAGRRDQLDLKPSSITTTLFYLVECGYLRKRGYGRYAPSERIARLLDDHNWQASFEQMHEEINLPIARAAE